MSVYGYNMNDPLDRIAYARTFPQKPRAIGRKNYTRFPKKELVKFCVNMGIPVTKNRRPLNKGELEIILYRLGYIKESDIRPSNIVDFREYVQSYVI